MTDTAMPERESRARTSPAQPAERSEPRFETPIVPQATIAGRALVAVVAIMTFLASLTIGAVVLIHAAASQWQSNVAREVTIQIRPRPGRDLEADMLKAAAITTAFAGVAEVRPYSKEESLRLLEPWLGTGLKFDDLPLPRIIVVRITPGKAPDLARLRRALAEQVPAASLDDHRGFVDRMRAITGVALALGVGVLALVLMATVLSVTFATHSAMATNRHVIEVLHLIGARDAFIGEHFQRHFLQLGLKGGAIGGASALALFSLLQLGGSWFTDTEQVDQISALFGGLSIGWLGYAGVLTQVGLIAFVTAATSRRTVNRTIAALHN
jgi:cell division transport system permease protein